MNGEDGTKKVEVGVRRRKKSVRVQRVKFVAYSAYKLYVWVRALHTTRKFTMMGARMRFRRATTRLGGESVR